MTGHLWHGTSDEEQTQQDILVPPQSVKYCCVHGVSSTPELTDAGGQWCPD